MSLTRRSLLGTAAATSLLPRSVRAQATRPIRIGVLNDLSGPFRDAGGMTSVACARQAVADFGQQFPVEIIFADHQNKPDVGSAIARQWFDQGGVDLIIDTPASSVALAVSAIAKDKNKALITSSAGSTLLTGAQCTPNTVQWTYSTYMLAKSTGAAMVRAGGKNWYMLTANYVFGHDLQRDTARFVEEAGGKVLGVATYPFPGTNDFSSFLLQAQVSGADVLALVNSGTDLTNCIKQANEFGLTQTMKLVAVAGLMSDVHGLGLEVAKGLIVTESFYWDLNERTRAFTKRLLEQQKPEFYPQMEQAGCYSGVTHYLKAVAKVGVQRAQQDGAAVIAAMKAMPADDDAFGHSTVRADGRQISPAYLFQVKTPAESKYPWDYYKLIGTSSGEEAYPPLSQSECKLVR